MKKILSFCLCLLLVCVTVSVFAQESELDLKVLPTVSGSEITALIEYSASDVCGGSFNFVYDTEALRLVDALEGEEIKDTAHIINTEYADGIIRVSWASVEKMPPEGELIIIKLELLSENFDKSHISIDKLKAADIDGNKLDTKYSIVYEAENTDTEENDTESSQTSGGTHASGGRRPSGSSVSKAENKTEDTKESETENITEVKSEKQLKFTDIKESDWYYEAVKFAFEKGITSGVSQTSYAPNDKVTRGQFITMLCRAYGIKEMTGDNFADCGNTWYTGYLAAAKALGISNGTGDNKFEPEKEISREEMVTLIYNYLKSVGKVDEETTVTSFADDAAISIWAKSGVAFASNRGYVKGKNNNLFDPAGFATRAELAQMFFNILA